MKAVFLLDEKNYNIIYSEETLKKISEKVDIIGRFDKKSVKDADLSDVDMVFSGWSGVRIDDSIISRAPKLKVIFYGSGSIKHVQSDAMWNKGIKITSASQANAIPVAQYTTSLIQLSLKDFFKLTNEVKEEKNNKLDVHSKTKGFYKRNIGIISYSKIGKLVCDNLKIFGDNKIFVYDPYYSKEDLEEAGLINASLEDIFSTCDLVSIHTPLLKETENLINESLLTSMVKNSTLINTARGKILNTKDLEKVLSDRKDITAILDVTDPEPLNADSPLYTYENVIISPHIAGSLGNETLLMGELMYEELTRFLNGYDLVYEISKAQFERMA